MAIRINQSTPPQLGRITMPQGTYLSNRPAFDNPGGAVDGGLGGSQGSNVSMWGNFTPGTNSLKGNNVIRGMSTGPTYNYFTKSYAQTPQIGAPGASPLQRTTDKKSSDFVVTGNKQLFYNELGQPVEYEQHHIWNGKETVTYNPVVSDARGNRYTWDATKNQYVRDSTGILAPKPSAPTNTLVGNDILSAPEQMTARQMQQIFPGKTPNEMAEAMAAAGYTRTYQAGVGEVYIKTGEPAPSQQLQSSMGPLNDRGRPEWVDGASLAPGERVTAASGATFVGGTPYTDKAGKTVGQYAVTVPGVKNDPKGRFKWKETVKKDSSGNWVKVYSQELRKVYSKRAYRMREDDNNNSRGPSREEGARRNRQQEQLVNLRVNYG